MQLTGAQIVMECLLEQGVDTVFGYPGGAVLNIYDALYEYRDRIRHIRTCHEQAAAHAADGYARASGKTGVCIATSGPGATNLVTGIATAYMDSIPMVAITGNVTRDLLGLDSFQEVDITGVTMPVTKHNFLVKDVNHLADTLRSAFRIANTGRKGPVLVDIPKDVTAQKAEFTPKKPSVPECSDFPPDERFAQALEMLKNSKRPFFYCGGGVVSADASKEAAEFAEKLDAPVSCSLMCQGGFDQTSRRYLGMLGMHGTKASAEAIKYCDLLVAAGTRFSDRVICNADLFARSCKIIQIDIDAAEFGKNIDVSLKLRGDVKKILAKLNEMLPQQKRPEWMDQMEVSRQAFPLKQTGGPNDVLPQDVLETLCRLTNGDAILTTEVGQHQMWAAQYYTFREPRHFLTSGGLGTMGYGLGAALGAKTARPEATVVNVAGDGSFRMNCAELSTLAHYKVPVVELIFDNQTLGMVRQWQKLFYGGRFSQSDVDADIDYAKLAEAFGVNAYRIASKDEIEPVLREALAQNAPVLVDCVISKDENVLPMVPAGKSVEDPILEM
jgi:acetolactate synthase-1/2/3 large subunit